MQKCPKMGKNGHNMAVFDEKEPVSGKNVAFCAIPALRRATFSGRMKKTLG